MAKNTKKENRLTKPFFSFSSLSLLCITTVILGMIFSLLLHTSYANWVEPEEEPAQGNVNPPINVSDITQTKEGGLNIATISGMVGIGTSSPQTNLHVLSSTSTAIRITAGPGGVAAIDLGDSDVGDEDVARIRYNNSQEMLRIATNPSGDNQWNDLVISGNNYIGLGTDDPKQRLHVYDSVSNAIIRINSQATSLAGIEFGDNIAGDLGKITYDNNFNRLKIVNNNWDSMVIGSGGTVGVNRDPSSNSRLSVAAEVLDQHAFYATDGTDVSVYGLNFSSGMGVQGWSAYNTGVYGYSATQTGVYAKSDDEDGYGLHAVNTNTGGDGYAAYIQGTSYLTDTVNIGLSGSELTTNGLKIFTNADLRGASIISEGLTSSAAVFARGTKGSSSNVAQGELGKVDGDIIYGVYGATTGDNPQGALGYRDTANSKYYGVYGKAGSGLGDNYAAYFESGPVKVSDGNLEVEDGQVYVQQALGNGIISEFTAAPTSLSYAVVGDASSLQNSPDAFGMKACGPDEGISSDPLCTYLGGHYYSGYFEGQIALHQMPNSLIPGPPIYGGIYFDPGETSRAYFEYNTEKNAVEMLIYRDGYAVIVHKFCGPDEDTTCNESNLCEGTSEPCDNDTDCYHLGCTVDCVEGGGTCKAYCDQGEYADPTLFCGMGFCCVAEPYEEEL